MEFLKNLSHHQIMYYALLCGFLLLSTVVKGKSFWNAILGDDGKLATNEIFQFITIYAVVVYGLEVLYYEIEFNLWVVVSMVLFAITGDIREIIKMIPDKMKKDN